MLGMAAVLPAFAQSKVDPVNKDGSGVAIKGYDPVAYFTQSKPVKGSASFTHQWMNSTWWFASAEDRDEFARTPEKYAPQYGGYCAYGVSQGHTAPIDPEAWTILNWPTAALLWHESQSVTACAPISGKRFWCSRIDFSETVQPLTLWHCSHCAPIWRR